MILFDYILLIILGYFAFRGYRKGLIMAVGSVISFVIAVIIASRYFDEFASFAAPYVGLGDKENLAKVLGFLVLLVGVSRLVLLGFSLIERTYTTLAVVPFMKLGNRVLGATLLVLEGAAILGLVLFFIMKFPFGNIVENLLVDSRVTPILLQIAEVVQPLIPQTIGKIQALM